MNTRLTLTIFGIAIIIWVALIYIFEDRGSSGNGGKFSHSAILKDTKLESLFIKNFPSTDPYQLSIDDVTRVEMDQVIHYTLEASLRNTGGGIGDLGTIDATYYHDTYNLRAHLFRMADLPQSKHYVGWLVKESPFHFIRVGNFTKLSGDYQLFYRSSNDYTDHGFFVVTEEFDSNTSPSEIFLEGRFSRSN